MSVVLDLVIKLYIPRVNYISLNYCPCPLKLESNYYEEEDAQSMFGMKNWRRKRGMGAIVKTGWVDQMVWLDGMARHMAALSAPFSTPAMPFFDILFQIL